MSLPWFRMYAEFAKDPVVQILAFEDQRHFVMLLCLKCSGALDKPLPPELRERMIASGLGLSMTSTADVKMRLREVGLIDESWQPVAWEKRQFQSDSSTPRVKRYRERQRNVSVTDQIQIQKQNTEAEVRGESEGRSRAARAPTATRLPDGFAMTEDMASYAAAQGIPVSETGSHFAAFCDYWRAESGAKARKHDWTAAWRTWCRRAKEQAARTSPLRSGDALLRAAPRSPAQTCDHGLNRATCVYCRRAAAVPA